MNGTTQEITFLEAIWNLIQNPIGATIVLFVVVAVGIWIAKIIKR